MKTLLQAVVALLLVSCGKSHDPLFLSKTGDFGAFLTDAVFGNSSQLKSSNRVTSWSYRVLTGRHQSGEYLGDRQALQIATAKTNFPWIEFYLTQELGAPS